MSRLQMARDHFHDASRTRRYQWMDTKRNWNDAQTRYFERQYLDLLDEQVKRALNRWDELIAAVAAAQSDLIQ